MKKRFDIITKITRAKILSLFFSLLLCTSCDSQTPVDTNQLNKSVDKAIKDYFENPTVDNEQLDPKVIRQFKDSGNIVKGFKEGVWTEYSVDTSSMGRIDTMTVGKKQLLHTNSAVLQKNHGAYKNGKKEGLWTLYTSSDKKAPFSFNRKITTNYKGGFKNGDETLWFLENKPLYIKPWKNDVEDGIGKVYDHNYPNNLVQVYKAVNGQSHVIENYYPDKKIKLKCTDTILNKTKLIYAREYSESGTLTGTSYYTEDLKSWGTKITYYESGKIESIETYPSGTLENYKYYHPNGQLWTERNYKEGKLWNIISNFDSKGNKKDAGTFKNGNETVKLYDADGSLTKTKTYENGEEK